MRGNAHVRFGERLGETGLVPRPQSTLHLVVKLNPNEASHWSDDEVLDRWTSLFRGPLLVQRYRDGEALTPTERDTVRSSTAIFQRRLASLSWFMKCLNEPIARKANAEDGCTGHFWEARFHSQPLCSDQALLTAMAYVDLNPIRAQLAKTPEQSKYTSIKARLDGDRNRNTVAGAVSRMLKRGELHHCNRLGRYEEAEPLLVTSVDALKANPGRRRQRANRALARLYELSNVTPASELY